MIDRRSMVIGLAALALVSPARRSNAQTAHTSTVTKIVDGDTVIIDRPLLDSREIRLVGIQTPKLPLGRAGFKPWPLSTEAKEFLERLVLGQEVALSFGGRRLDRHRRLLAHLHLAAHSGPPIWVQGAILRAGLGRVYSFPDNRAFVHKMLEVERIARTKRAGIWSHPFYAIRNPDPETLSTLLGTFQLVEGRVTDTATIKRRTYINFGANWRTDFTATVGPRFQRAFRDSSLDLLALKGQSVRVRGWLDERNGPMIELTHPEEIEVLTR